MIVRGVFILTPPAFGTLPKMGESGVGMRGLMTEYNSLEKIRLQKIEELRAEGIEPYPTRAERTHTSAEAMAAFEAAEKTGEEVKATLAGRIRATRAMGKISNESPIGKAILNHKVGDIVKVETPAGTYNVKILKVG